MKALLIALTMLSMVSACGGTPTATPSPALGFVGGTNCLVSNTDGSQSTPYLPSPPGTNGAAIGQAIQEMPHSHINFPTKTGFNHNPPTSGCHYSIPGEAPVSAGAYDQTIAPEFWVHNLEHGYIVVLYNCPGGQYNTNGCTADFNQIVTWMKAQPKDPGGFVSYAKIVVLPDPDMPVKFAAVAWDWYQGWSTLDVTAINAFYQNHVGHSPEGATTG